MTEKNSTKQQVEEAVATFAYDFMGVTPKSVVADIHSHSVLATLQGIIPPAERDYAEGEPEGRDLLEKCYNNVFDVAKKAFEAALENILGQIIQGSMLRVNAESGDGVMVFNLADRSPAQEQ
jgi:uncharacterized protein YbcI